MKSSKPACLEMENSVYRQATGRHISLPLPSKHTLENSSAICYYISGLVLRFL